MDRSEPPSTATGMPASRASCGQGQGPRTPSLPQDDQGVSDFKVTWGEFSLEG